MFQKNDVIKFSYWQPNTGDESERYGRIVSWRRLTQRKIEKLQYTKYRLFELLVGDFKRVGVLLTIEHIDGTIKNYWTKQVPLPKKCWKFGFIVKRFLKRKGIEV